ncbi:MAG TPA: SH3 domain-containing protein [Blastocatellia bacterium]|nr:SH3 domain-containing protein [Blastocatellia bacterium]
MKGIPAQLSWGARRPACAALLFLLPLCCSCTGNPPGSSQPATRARITAASGVRLRSAPSGSADEVAKLPLGVVVRELEQSSNKEQVGGVEDYWYRVSTSEGREGWLFGGFTAPFEPDRKAEIYRRIADERLKAQDATFADYADLVRFLTDAVAEVTQPEARAELELARLLAMRRAAEEIPMEKQQEPPYQEWIAANEESIVYNEPAGQWLVRSDLFWDLQKQYSALPIAERIAWEGAKNGLPGECEGYFPCYLGGFNLTMGKYLDLYPNGAHADEAINELIESLTLLLPALKSGDAPDDMERNEARKELDTLRKILSKTDGPKKDTALKLLEEAQKHYS